jgi:phosphoglycerate kinase
MTTVCEKYHITPISDLQNISSKIFLVRVDFNVPIGNTGIILDSFRIKNSIPTIDFLLKNNAIVILISHLGDPKSPNETLSFSPLIEQMEIMLNCQIHLLVEHNLQVIGDQIDKHKTDIGQRKVFLLDNIRHFPEEKTNDSTFANAFVNQLRINFYVNDAFSVSHRKHTSVVAIPSIMERKFAGLALVRELEMLESTLGNAFNSQTKITAIIGGKKVATKLLLLKSLTKKVHNLVIVGGMANTFLKARGVDIGESFYEPDMLAVALDIKNCILPIDFVNQDCEVVTDITGNMAIYDIGPRSLNIIDSIISDSDLILWNGPAGIYEDARFAGGSHGIATSINKYGVKAIVGGGDTVAIINKLDTSNNIYISSGGGAFIAWLKNRNLPGIIAISAQ